MRINSIIIAGKETVHNLYIRHYLSRLRKRNVFKQA